MANKTAISVNSTPTGWRRPGSQPAGPCLTGGTDLEWSVVPGERCSSDRAIQQKSINSAGGGRSLLERPQTYDSDKRNR